MPEMSANTDIQFSDAMKSRMQEYISHFPEGKQKSAILPILHLVQDNYGWLSPELMDKVAEVLQIQPIEVYEVATFYTMYNLKPVGKFKLEFCRTSPCCLRGSEDLMDYTLNKLGVKEGETTPDGLFTVIGVECLGACGYAPMMQVGDRYIEHLTPEKMDDFIEHCKASANN
jgi:NADH-quinone oxidoreductase subunit E